jgi:hypothetical protein
MSTTKPKKTPKKLSTVRCMIGAQRIIEDAGRFKSWLQRLARDGKIRLTKIGRCNFILPDDHDEFIRRASSGEFAIESGGACAKKGTPSHD